MIRSPFKIYKNAPEPLTAEIESEVRFDEVDMMGIVWHGRYISYLEKARVAVGDKYGMGYMDFYGHSFAAPLKKIDIDYRIPMKFKDKFKVTVVWHWCPSARINMEYTVTNSMNETTAAAYSVQLFTDTEGKHLLYAPDYYAAFLSDWESGNIATDKK